MNKSLNYAIPIILIAIVGFIFLSNNSSKVMRCGFLPTAKYKKGPEFFELKGSKVVACGLKNISPLYTVTRQKVTDGEITYTCSFVDIDTHVTVNRYTGAASVFFDKNYLNSHNGTCKEVSEQF